MTNAWKADLARVADQFAGPMKQMAQLQHVQRQMAQALKPAIDVAKLMPKFKLPSALSESASRAIAQAMSPAIQAQVAQLRVVQVGIAEQLRPALDVTRLMPTPAVAAFLSASTTISLANAVAPVLEKMRALDAIHSQLQQAFQPSIDATRLLASVNFSDIRTDELSGEIERATRDLQASLPRDIDDELASELSGAVTGVEDSPSLEAQALLLLVACAAAVAAISPGAGQVFVGLLAAIVENGIVAAGLAFDAYRELSKVVPDDNVVAWALAFAGLLSWLRRSA